MTNCYNLDSVGSFFKGTSSLSETISLNGATGVGSAVEDQSKIQIIDENGIDDVNNQTEISL